MNGILKIFLNKHSMCFLGMQQHSMEACVFSFTHFYPERETLFFSNARDPAGEASRDAAATVTDVYRHSCSLI